MGENQSSSRGRTQVPPEHKENTKENTIESSQVEELYQAYPRHQGKGQARKVITKALRDVPFEELLDAVNEYAKAVAAWLADQRQFVPLPATWFNDERWLDDRETWKRDAGRAGTHAASRLDAHRKFVTRGAA